MLTVIKQLFVPQKDYAGRDIDNMIMRLAAQTGTDITAWSYINELSVYENTLSGMRVYPHELSKYAA
ncbi:hypothetical protein JCM19233_381 [Vibrio astriarenae]|uniref:Uncharacterized protein n=1 Tax=Vibrio astriarenae TaxID=1481923 RepID=A0A7Z2T6L0_9VIBR|nr:hypothetical protein [Vibrio astriarenae]QIA65092.1 hypothetical protein GT360_16145 [Vibrio astriarenae]GAL09415.1 hypothetical protein JCM19233_381 [Vibrio sp. C7]